MAAAGTLSSHLGSLAPFPRSFLLVLPHVDASDAEVLLVEVAEVAAAAAAQSRNEAMGRSEVQPGRVG